MCCTANLAFGLNLVECRGFYVLCLGKVANKMENLEQRVKKIVAEQLGVAEADIKIEYVKVLPVPYQTRSCR